MASKKVDYKALSAELEQILGDLQNDELDVDAAVQKYQRGREVITQLEAHLTAAEHIVTELKATDA